MTEVYSIVTDFIVSEPEFGQLKKEIEKSTITTELDSIDVEDDVVSINFTSALSGGEKATMDFLVANHTPIVPIGTAIKSFDALVASDGEGDFLLPSDAFAAGATTVYVKPGTYIETADILIPNHGVLIGESQSPVMIMFQGNYSIKADASNGVSESDGTISIVHDTNVVTGSGTTFTNLNVSDSILLDQNYYQIDTITNDTSLTIVKTYRGKSLSNVSYIAQKMFSGINLANLCIGASDGTGIYFRAVESSSIQCCVTQDNQKGIELYDCASISINSVSSRNNDTMGIFLSNCHACNFVSGESQNNGTHGYRVCGASRNIVFNGAYGCNNGEYGLIITGAACKMLVNDCSMENNNKSGVEISANSRYVVIDGCVVWNNTDNGVSIIGSDNTISSCAIIANDIGVKIAVDSDTNIIDSNRIADNNLGIEIPATSDDNVIDSNIVTGSVSHGISLAGSNCVVTGNRVKTNGGDGCYIANGAINNTVKSNRLAGNTGADLNDNGTTTIKDI